ncbi:DUF1761 domain-containing protein [Salsuginibacillus kocurii]|uniref:DUF1761 domain-containing protein n=1 Tax=Salsuginibacillus kocurii TaxID=427078 RepID=UPI00036710BB|nr:DUF1761 domain-containing protein [Salsuginibacillus kocurii]
MILPIVTGIILYMIIGMLYYSPFLFGNRWVQLLQISPSQPRYGLLTLVTILTSTLLYSVLHLAQASTVGEGALIGCCLGVIIALAYAKDFLFGLGSSTKNPFSLYLLSVGYHLIALSIIGAVMMMF